MVSADSFISGSVDKTLKIWKLDNPECVQTMQLSKSIYALKALKNKNLVFVGAEGNLNLITIPELIVKK